VSKKVVYILHKNGSNSHYTGLKHLLSEQNTTLKYREFSIISTFFKALLKGNGRVIKKQIVNFLFLLNLFMSKHKRVVLGIAPFDKKLVLLTQVLKNHTVYYHTSWTCWDGSFHPKQDNNSPKVRRAWKNFLENMVKHIFCVTIKSKSEILKHYNVKKANIHVVNHAADPAFFQPAKISEKKPLSFIYYGRLVPEKGIEELLDFFADQQNAILTIIGNGKLIDTVKLFSDKFKNITHLQATENKEELIHKVASHQYLVLNSKKSPKWEELFGLTIIESMALGTIPIATNHTGPKEILTPDLGYLCEEHNLIDKIAELIEIDAFDENMSKNCKKIATNYKVNNIGKKWNAILY
jgi:glycosyltransferase involved in cell wall biosynthesis